MYDNIIIGAGLSALVVARELAEKYNQSSLMVERRTHIGGNCHDALDEHGVLIHCYGPHIFHTNNELIFNYLSRYTSWHHFEHKVLANIDGKQLPIPFNMNTLEAIYSEERAAYLRHKMITLYGEGSRVTILELLDHPDKDIVEVARFVYENIFLGYTTKQWGIKPEAVDPSVTARVPILIAYDNRYFQDRYQGVPANGYADLFERMRDHPLIELRLNTDAKAVLSFKEGLVYFEGQQFKGNVICTGAIDELFDYKYGELPYRTLDFCFVHHKIDRYQSAGVVNYTKSETFTRITEFKALTGQTVMGTTLLKEYPRDCRISRNDIPYYAIINSNNQKLYQKYASLSERYDKLYMLGRLAEYQYYNMDVIVEKALQMAYKIGTM